MNEEEKMSILDDEDVNIQENEYEEELDDFDEEEPQPFMTAIAVLGVIIALAIIVCIVFLLVRSGRNDDEDYAASVETEQEMSTEELATSESIDSEAATEQEMTVIENETVSLEEVETVSVVSDEETSQSVEVNVQEEPVSGNESMEFTEISDTVTAKDVTNLRSIPSTLDEENVVSQLMNGEAVSRTGINDATGWSRLDYNGQIVYAVSNYLTTDLSYKPPVTPSNPNRVNTQDGRVIIFTDYNDYVTPKEYVNLRVEPSTSEGESTVKCQIKNGETVHRTGYSADSGWSRVEYNGEILYVVSSMVYSIETSAE